MTTNPSGADDLSGSADDLAGTVCGLLTDALADNRFSSASCRIAVNGTVLASVDLGSLASIDDTGALIPVDRREPTTAGTLYDLASITKVHSAITLLRLVDSGELALDDPIGGRLPDYASGQKAQVTLRHLLTHTAGLPGVWNGWRAPLDAARDRIGRSVVLRGTPLAAQRDALTAGLLACDLERPPGSAFGYSCVGYLTAMLLAESSTGTAWPELVKRHALAPLGLTDGLTFVPDRDRTAATEHQGDLGRGTVRGDTHDELAWSLGGACANAGLFGTADGVLRLAEAIRGESSDLFHKSLWDNQLPALLGRELASDADAFGMSLGLRIGDQAWMGSAGRTSRGHTGFTGTSIQVDRERGVSIVLLTNRVHPSRDGMGVHDLRAAIAAAALGVPLPGAARRDPAARHDPS